VQPAQQEAPLLEQMPLSVLMPVLMLVPVSVLVYRAWLAPSLFSLKRLV